MDLTQRFDSPLYRYTIGINERWTVHAATKLADDPSSTESTGTDVITVTGTDTTIQTIASELGGQPFVAWLQTYRAGVTRNVPSGCDGGDPASWPPITIGKLNGVLEQKCNAAVAIVAHGGKAYQFAWENSTFDATNHMSQADFTAVLRTVNFV